MKSIGLSALTVAASMALAMDDASAQRSSGVQAAGVGGVGVNCVRLKYRLGLGAAAAGLAIGATKTSAAYTYGGYDSGHSPTRAEYIERYRGTGYISPAYDPQVDRVCQ